MLAHILVQGGVDCVAFLGGIMVNYKSNLVLNKRDFKKAVAVVEADEFDRSFLQLFPNEVIITSIEPDHLDIYDSYSDIIEAFKILVGKLPIGNRLICNKEAYKNLSPDLK